MLSLALSYYLCQFVGLAYPAWASVRALETRDPEDDKQWLTYWIVYGILQTLDICLGFILHWIPLYYELKLIFTLWMIAPQTKGAAMMYEKYLKPALAKYASKIDPVFSATHSVMESSQFGMVMQLVEKYGPTVAEQALEVAATKAEELAGAAAGVIEDAAANARKKEEEANNTVAE